MNKKTIYLVFIFTFLISCVVFPEDKTDKLSLSKDYPLEVLGNILIPKENWKPFPTADNRDGWNSISENIRKSYIGAGEKVLGYNVPSLPATLFLEFARYGNRSNFERNHSARRSTLANLVIAECMEGKDRFLDDISNLIWAICEETFWGVPAHLYLQKAGNGLPDVNEPVIDLYASETGALLAWTDYLLGPQLDKVSPLIRERIKIEEKRRILKPYLERDDFWWMGLVKTNINSGRVNNWNPWCNSNCLECVLLLEEDSEKLIYGVNKAMRSLNRFVDDYTPDGGCTEGPSYWNVAGGSLFNCLELLQSVSNDKINFYNEPLIKEIGRYIYKVQINDNYYINFADGPGKLNISGDLVYQYGIKIGDRDLSALGAYAAKKELSERLRFSGNIYRQISTLFEVNKPYTAESYQPLLRDVWLKDIQVMAARSEKGSANGLYLGAKGGNNGEHHNHNDVGNFIIYSDGEPVIIDVGVGTYTKETFSEERYSIWTMQSAYHNLPTINGVMQKEGSKYAAKNMYYKADDNFAEIKMDIAGAYPKEAGVDLWERTIRLNRNKNIIVKDSYRLNRNDNDLMLSIMTPCDVTVDKPGQAILNSISDNKDGKKVKTYLKYDSEKIEIIPEKIVLDDNRLKGVWGDKLIRIIFKIKNPKNKDTLELRIQ